MYTFLYNILDMPTGVLPISKVQANEQHYHDKSYPETETLNQQANLCMQGSAGLPLGVQVSGLPYEDEKCFGIMKYMEGLFKWEIETLGGPLQK